jgi:hypothetical protein
MNLRLLIGFAGLAVLVIVIVLTMIRGGSERGPAPESTPEITPTAEPTGDVEPTWPPDPIFKALPHGTPNWNLVYVGESGGKFQLLATIYFRRGEEAGSVEERERPNVKKSIEGVGQPEDSYEIEYRLIPYESIDN